MNLPLIQSAHRLLPSGTVLHERYRITAFAGGGQMGVVYRAEEIGLSDGRSWAIKELRLDAMDSARVAQELFRNEGQTLASLDHPGLPRVVDFFVEQGRWYLVMDFIEGRNLLQELDARGEGAVPEALVLDWALQISEVLAYLHQQAPPIVFRDVKPSNAMLSPNGRVKLIDFGIARKFKPEKTRDTVLMGAENYSPPEQWGSGQCDARSDIYALGATMYHLLTGDLPRSSFMGGPKAWPAELRPEIGASTDRVVRRAMAASPDERFSTALAMAEALRACASARPRADLDTKRACPFCHKPVRPSARFCGWCGAHLTRTVRVLLRVVGETGPTWEVPVSGSSFLIGRRSVFDGIYPDLDLSNYDPQFVSRRHAEIVFREQGLALRDLQSENHTFLNDDRQPLDAHTLYPLHNGDLVKVGNVELVVHMVAD